MIHSKQRLNDLVEAWQRGALDETLRIHVINKRKDFKASNLSWVGSGSQDVTQSGTLCDVDPLGQQQHELTEAEKKSIMGQFQEWAQTLEIEGTKHKLWLTEVQDFDSKQESNLQRFHNDLAMRKKVAVAQLCNSYYSSHGFDTQDEALIYLQDRVVQVANIPPTRPEGSVLRLIWADMAQLGKEHSHHTRDILDFFRRSMPTPPRGHWMHPHHAQHTHVRSKWSP